MAGNSTRQLPSKIEVSAKFDSSHFFIIVRLCANSSVQILSSDKAAHFFINGQSFSTIVKSLFLKT